MVSVIEDTVKALIEFESELDRVKAESADARKKMLIDASDWSASSRSSAVAKAQELAAATVSKATEEAEMQANEIRTKGEASLKSFETALSKHRTKAAHLVVARLLGESP